jgi:hypothetical protein
LTASVRTDREPLLPETLGWQILTGIEDFKWKSSILAGERGYLRGKFRPRFAEILPLDGPAKGDQNGLVSPDRPNS